MTREEILKVLKNWMPELELAAGYNTKSILDDRYNAIYTVIKKLEQEPKTGRWIDTGSGQQCSECGEIQYGYDNYRRYCAYCGAKMESEGG